MKKVLFIFLASVAAFLSLLDLHAQAGGSVSPSAAARGISRDVYISYRTDGRAGKGTKDDPFDGSTAAKFDAVLQAIKADSYNLFIGPGTFLTRGTRDNQQFTNGKSYRIQGSGQGVTTLKLEDNTYPDTASTDTAIFRHWDFWGQVEYFELSDLTLDCNPTGQPIYSGAQNGDLGAVVVCSRRSWLHDFTATGMWSRGGETFPITAHSITGNASELNHVIERVRATADSGYMTIVNILCQTGSTNRVSGVIRDCTITGNADYTVGVGQAGIGAGGWDGVTVENNRLVNMVAGVVIDTLNYRNVTFRGNQFEACSYGIIYNGGGTYDGVQILNNHFGPLSGSTALLPPSTLPTAQLIAGNKFETDTVGTTNAVTQSELNYLKGVTSNIQAQLDAAGGGGGVTTNATFYEHLQLRSVGTTRAKFSLIDLNADADEKIWQSYATNGVFYFRAEDDSSTVTSNAFSIRRNGSVPDLFTISTPETVIEGNLTVNGTISSGGVIQFTNRVFTNLYSTTSTTYTNSGYSVTLPANLKDTGSRVKITVNGICGAAALQGGVFTLASWDGVTETILTTTGTDSMAVCYIAASSAVDQISIAFVHSPGSVTPLEYRLMFKCAVAGTIYVGKRGADGLYHSSTTLTATEID